MSDSPVGLDGSTLVVLRDASTGFRTRFEIVRCGRLSYDGETLRLKNDSGATVWTLPDELPTGICNVTPANRIPECDGYDLFLIE
jgi:hypothetical protein